MDNMTIYKSCIREFDRESGVGPKIEAMYRIISIDDIYFFAEEIATGCIFPVYSRTLFSNSDHDTDYVLHDHQSYLNSGKYFAYFPLKMKPGSMLKCTFDDNAAGRGEITTPSVDEVNNYIFRKKLNMNWRNKLMMMESSNEYLCDLSSLKEIISATKDGIEVINLDFQENEPQYMRMRSNIDLKPIADLGYDLSTQSNLCDLIGREDELKKVIKTLAIKGKSVILLGDPGVGKTSIPEKLALDIRDGKSKFLGGKVIFSLSTANLVAGTKYRGEFEDKLKGLIEFCKKNKGKIILFIDEIHTLYGLGSSTESPIDAMNILKPYISNGDLTIIGATTKAEYEEHMANDPAFLRRFENVEVTAPDKKMLIEIMLSYIKELEKKYMIKLNLNDKEKLQIVERIFNITDGKCAYVTGNVKIENPTLAKNILENAFAEAIYNGRKKVTIDEINFSIQEYDKLSLEFMSEFGYDLSKSSKLCNLVGREKELEKIIKAIAIEDNSVLLLGESGVGKSSIPEKLALDIRDGKCDFLKGKIIFYLNTASLSAGAKYLGEFEKKMEKLINTCRKNKGKIILFIDEIHTLYGLGRSSDSAIAAMNILKPYISNGDLTIIGATTQGEYEKYMANDPAFLRRFEKVDIFPLDDETKIQILITHANDQSEKYKLKINFNGISIYQLMKYIVEITEMKYQNVKGDVKVENITIAKRLIENAFSDAVYHSKTVVTIEDIYMAIFDCDKLPVEFRIQCAKILKEYIYSGVSEKQMDVLSYAKIRRQQIN